MGWLGTQKTLCLFEVDLKGPVAPACTARVAAVVYAMLDAAAWATQRYTSHFPDRHLFPARFARGEQFWTAQHEARSCPIVGRPMSQSRSERFVASWPRVAMRYICTTPSPLRSIVGRISIRRCCSAHWTIIVSAACGGR